MDTNKRRFASSATLLLEKKSGCQLFFDHKADRLDDDEQREKAEDGNEDAVGNDAGSYDDRAIQYEQDHAQFQKFEHMLNEQGDDIGTSGCTVMIQGNTDCTADQDAAQSSGNEQFHDRMDVC